MVNSLLPKTNIPTPDISIWWAPTELDSSIWRCARVSTISLPIQITDGAKLGVTGRLGRRLADDHSQRTPTSGLPWRFLSLGTVPWLPGSSIRSMSATISSRMLPIFAMGRTMCI